MILSARPRAQQASETHNVARTTGPADPPSSNSIHRPQPIILYHPYSHTELPEVPSEPPMTEIGRSRFRSALSAPGECSQRGISRGRGDHSHTLASCEHPRRRARQLQHISHDGQAGRMNRSWFSRFEQVQRALRSSWSTARPLCTSLMQAVELPIGASSASLQ